jgi:hypothetical protein
MLGINPFAAAAFSAIVAGATPAPVTVIEDGSAFGFGSFSEDSYSGSLVVVSTATTVAETVNGTDAVAANGTFNSSSAETALIVGDTFASALTAGSATSETATGTDTVAASVARDASVAEAATGTDAIAASASSSASVAETATGTDAIAASASSSASVAETATGTDAIAANASNNASVAEAATGTDVIAADVVSGSGGVVAETATATDAIDASVTAAPNGVITELASLVAPQLLRLQPVLMLFRLTYLAVHLSLRRLQQLTI